MTHKTETAQAGREIVNSLTDEQKARIYALHLGAKIRAYDADLTLNALLPSTWEQFSIGGAVQNAYTMLLKPLSAITDEDAIEVAKICTGIKESDRWFVGVAESTFWRYVQLKDTVLEVRIMFKQLHIIVCNVYNNSVSHSDNPCVNLAIQFLIQQGYAVPLFIAPNHPDNGKDAIQLGLAIDNTQTPPNK